MANTKRLLLALFLFFGVLFLGVSVTAYLLLRDEGPALEESSWLEIDLQGGISEQPNQDPVLAAVGSLPLSLLELDDALQSAAEDEDIEGVLLSAENMAVGMARIEEVIQSLQRFQESGKKVVFWGELATNKDYLLASACDEVYFAPEGMLLFTGLRFEMTFFAGALEKLGVEADFTRAGTYKSAVEQYLREDMSEASREQMTALADSFYGRVVELVSAHRELTPEQVRAIIDTPSLSMADAQERGLVDGLLYRDELETQLAGEGEDFNSISLGEYYQPGSGIFGRGPRIAIVYAQGQIMGGESSNNRVGSDTMVETLREVREDDNVEAVVIRVDSPGGSGLASDLIWREVQLTREEKPVIVSMGDLAASGGYYIAMGSDAIVAQPTTLTGSIGVFSGKFNLRGLAERMGITFDTIQRGDQAEVFSAIEGLGAEERATMDAFVAHFYRVFVQKAADGRGRTWDEIDAVAQGRVWSGQDALEQGLVDELGGLSRAIEIAKERASLDADRDVSLEIHPRQPTVLELWLERSGMAHATDEERLRVRLTEIAGLLPPQMRDSVLLLLTSDAARGGAPLALLPFTVHVD